jgi:hypothetical protein
VGKVDVKGAEFVIRAGCLARERALIDYLRGGRDGHAKTASLFTGKPESAFAKGKKDRWYRDDVAKGSNFLLIYGGSWKALQGALWTQSRTKLEDDEAKRLRTVFFGPEGYPDIARQYEDDTAQMVERGYIEDDFGRRWTMRMPEGLRARRRGDGTWSFLPTEKLHEDDQKALYDMLSHCRHCYANRRTQADNATMLLWTLALCHHGEYVQLQLPPTWEHHGLPFPEAEAWELNEGRGPGRKPFKVWITNEVHDSLWLDGAPGTLEPAMMVAFRRSLGLPADLMLDADMLRRVEAEVGPDLGHLQPYEVVAQKFGLAEMPAW